MPAIKVTTVNPWHIVLVLDDSTSMAKSSAGLNRAVRAMIEELRAIARGKSYYRYSIISFGSRANVLTVAQPEQAINLDTVLNLEGNSGSTDAAGALGEALRVLTENPGEPEHFTPYVFFFSDGAPNDKQLALQAAARIKELDIPAGKPIILAFGFGSEVDDAFMEQVATTPEFYKKFDKIEALLTLLPAIGTILVTRAADSESVGPPKEIANI